MHEHKWEWKRCPAAETPEEERARAALRLRAPPGKYKARMCEVCGHIEISEST